MEKLNINQWAEEDRPREKMMQKGAEALSDAELLAILIGSGNTEESAVSLMQRILAAADNNLHRLGKWQVADFARFKGMGPAKSISVMAALELGKRRTLQEKPERPAMRSSSDILLQRATQLALVHNHPSGNVHPSTDDIHLTHAVRDAARLMNIRLLDHVIVTDGAYYSFNDEGRL